MDSNFAPTEHVLWLMPVFCGIFMCKIVYDLTGFFSSLHFRKYNKLAKEEQIEWNNRGFSSFHAILSTSVAFYLLFLSDVFQDKLDDGHGLIINRRSSVSDFICCISLGYFLTDLGMILWLFPTLGGKEYILHHGVSIYSLTLALVTGKGHIYILMILLSEATTPFVNLRWYLDVADQKNSKIYLYNGMALFLCWLVARIFLFIYITTHLYIHFDQIIHHVKPVLPIAFYSMFLVLPTLATMNGMWFWKIFKGMRKTISRKRHNA